MRNLRKYIIASVTLVASVLSFGSVAMAQAIRYDKKVSGPNEKGVFTLNLEAYATGSVTVETKPSDIILVLDKSGSMAYNMSGTQTSGVSTRNQRISALKEAVQGFVQNLKDTPVNDEFKDTYGGHRIAIVWFAGEAVWEYDFWGNRTFAGTQNEIYEDIDGLNQFINVEDLTTTAASTGNNYQQARITYNGNNLLGVTADGGTKADYGMRRAKTILSEQSYSDKPNRSRLVVFFTDGDPGLWAEWTKTNSNYQFQVDDTWDTADGCISAANDIKNSTAYSATVYSVGLFTKAEGTADRTTTYLSYTSSDYTDKTAMATSGWVPVSKDKSITVSSASELNNIFSSISSSAASAASGSSVLVDIVASNFNIPTNTNLGEVKVYRVPCTQASAQSIISFSPRTATGDLAWEDITNSIGLDKSKQAQGEISVTGFDYGANWCGWDASANNMQGAAHGSKLVLEIPITVKDDIVGGPSMDTNAPGSKLIVKNKAGEVIEELEFISPIVKVPVTIWIKKEGLLSNTADGVQGHEDNAVFTLRKTKFLGRYETDANGNELTDKHIDYLYSNKGKKYLVNGVETEMVWTTFTKVTVNMKDGEGIAKISGLDADYVYRIEEDAWAHLGYDFDPDETAQYTLEWDETAKRYKELSNPFTFTNTPKTKAFYSEDVYRNVFGQGSSRPTE
ncbi:MAG: VWA domain-containing protein [Bacteroidales bacterium]|nr:VWA domain-containing protein [Bacteroidales bacterium]